MIKAIIGIMIGTLIFAIGITLLTNNVIIQVKNEKAKYEAKVGQKFILEKDTLTIINYSSIMETFTLSNGKEISASIVFNNDSI